MSSSVRESNSNAAEEQRKRINPTKPNSSRIRGELALSSHDRVAPCRLTEPFRTELRDPLLSLEVDINQSEAVAEAIGPLEVVLCAPEEVTIHRYAVGSRTLELGEVGAQEHDPIGVVHLAIVGDHVRRA